MSKDTGEVEVGKNAMSEPISMTSIGVIHSEHQDPAATPIQPAFAEGSQGSIELFPEYVEGLAGLEGFSHVILLYLLHKAGKPMLTVTPFLDDQPKGVFATRSPKRPNGIGLSIVRLMSIEGTSLNVENLDILDGTPLLDIKPYVPRFDYVEGAYGGWTEKVDPEAAQVRGRRGWRGGR